MPRSSRLSVQAQPSGRAATDQDFRERSAVDMVAGRTIVPSTRPPIFPPQTGGSQAKQYLRRGMQFRDAAMPLSSYVNGETNWPRIALLAHAIELALKGYVLHAVECGSHPAPTMPPANHDLEGWYKIAVDFGLPDGVGLSEGLAVLNELHKPHFARYPQSPIRPVPDLAAIPDQVVEHLISVCMPVIFPR
jgi:hypothetical protein